MDSQKYVLVPSPRNRAKRKCNHNYLLMGVMGTLLLVCLGFTLQMRTPSKKDQAKDRGRRELVSASEQEDHDAIEKFLKAFLKRSGIRYTSESQEVQDAFDSYIDIGNKTCGVGYSYFDRTGYCYKTGSEKSGNYSKARKVCELEENAHLVSIHSKEENTFVIDLVAKENENAHRSKEELNVFIGLVYANSRWEWLDGTEVDYTNWMSNVNDGLFDGVDSRAVISTKNGNQDGGWKEKLFSLEESQYVCKKRPTLGG